MPNFPSRLLKAGIQINFFLVETSNQKSTFNSGNFQVNNVNGENSKRLFRLVILFQLSKDTWQKVFRK